MKWISGGVTAAEGFTASGISAGIKRSRKPDLSLVFAESSAMASAVFTRNRLLAAPVRLSQARIRRGQARAVLINSGCANCMTGAAGLRDAHAISQSVARQLGIAARDVLVASTGIIGQRLPVVKVTRAIPRLVRELSRDHHEAAAQAILTTDLHAKESAVEVAIGGRRCRLGGMAKGSGMIAPAMATMLGVLTTDVQAESRVLTTLLREAVEQSFNRISIDGDMSTNDTVFLLASGRSGVSVRDNPRALEAVRRMLRAVTHRLAQRLVWDGEGATQGVRIQVRGAQTQADALRCARRVACSPLVKTMFASGDPNMGRIGAAVGASGARFHPDRLSMTLSGVGPVVRRGTLMPFDRRAAHRVLRASRPAWPVITIDLHAGSARAAMTTCDLTEEYVRINSHYST